MAASPQGWISSGGGTIVPLRGRVKTRSVLRCFAALTLVGGVLYKLLSVPRSGHAVPVLLTRPGLGRRWIEKAVGVGMTVPGIRGKEQRRWAGESSPSRLWPWRAG